jgi:hypothetical protein
MKEDEMTTAADRQREIEEKFVEQGMEIIDVKPSDRSVQHFNDTLKAATAFRKQAVSYLKKRTDQRYKKALRAFLHLEECGLAAMDYIAANHDSKDPRVLGGVIMVTGMLRPRVEPMYQLWQSTFSKLEAGETVRLDQGIVRAAMYPKLPKTYHVENDGTVVSHD